MQEKHTYFLLAAAGACIGFALTQSKDMALSASMYPLGAALALWGVSFLLGCRHIEGALSITFANIGLLKMRSGRDPLAGQNPSLIALGDQTLQEIIEKKQCVSSRAGRWQNRCLILGVLCYVAWQVLLMQARPVP